MTSGQGQKLLEGLLMELVSRIPGALAAGLVDLDGFVMVGAGQWASTHRLGLVAAGALNVAEHALAELSLGVLENMHVRGRDGSVVLIRAGKDVVLVVATDGQAKIGTVLAPASEVAARIEGIA